MNLQNYKNTTNLKSKERLDVALENVKVNQKIMLGSFVFSLIGFIALLAVAIVYVMAGGIGFFKAIIEMDQQIVNTLGYVIVALSIAIGWITAILNAIFLIKDKKGLQAFLIITLVFNLIFPIVLLAAFILLTINPQGAGVDQFYEYFYIAALATTIVFAFLQVISNIFAGKNYKKSYALKTKTIEKKIESSMAKIKNNKN